MIREMYYEESAVPVNARKEEKLNKGFTIAAIVFFVLSAFYFFFALMNIASLFGDEELETIDRVVGSLMTLSFFVVGVLIGVLLLIGYYLLK